MQVQSDWARQQTYQDVMDVVGPHAGAYGAGTFYAGTMFGGHEVGGYIEMISRYHDD